MAKTVVEEERNEDDDAADNDQAAIVDTTPEVTQMRNEMNKGYDLRKSTKLQHVYAALTIKAATAT